jgi:hypothetical protein
MHEERAILNRIAKAFEESLAVQKEALAVQYEVRGRLNRILQRLPAETPTPTDKESSQESGS